METRRYSMWGVGESRASFGVAWDSGVRDVVWPWLRPLLLAGDWLESGGEQSGPTRKHLTPKLGAVICRVRESQYILHAD